MIKFYLCTPLSILYNLYVLSKNCRHIKTYKEYLEGWQLNEWPTPLREELMWWQRTMNGNVIKFPVGFTH